MAAYCILYVIYIFTYYILYEALYTYPLPRIEAAPSHPSLAPHSFSLIFCGKNEKCRSQTIAQVYRKYSRRFFLLFISHIASPRTALLVSRQFDFVFLQSVLRNVHSKLPCSIRRIDYFNKKGRKTDRRCVLRKRPCRVFAFTTHIYTNTYVASNYDFQMNLHTIKRKNVRPRVFPVQQVFENGKWTWKSWYSVSLLAPDINSYLCTSYNSL